MVIFIFSSIITTVCAYNKKRKQAVIFCEKQVEFLQKSTLNVQHKQENERKNYVWYLAVLNFVPVSAGFLIIYFITPKKFRNAVLFLGSIAFYTYGEAQYVLLLLASVTVNYVIARSMYKTPEDGRGRRQAVLLVLALCYDFGMLFFFKYSGLTTKAPLGISFYTFQIAAYVIDVYRGIVPAEKSYVNLGTYLTMFPQLIAGPIVNYTEVSSCLKRRTVTARDFESGVRILVIGLGSKVIIADRVGMLWNNVQTIGFNSISTPLAWLGAVAYSMELYFDFAGYSMMAVGLGKMLGFQIPVNFRFPYISKSVTEFWRRWHITLGRWFRDYVYIPLGGSRKGRLRTMFNLFAVWILTALWHGAGYNFLIWGGMLLGALFLEKLFLLPFLQKSKVIGHVYLLLFVPVTWMAFTITDVHQLGIYLTRMFPFVNAHTGMVNSMDYIKYLKDYDSLLAMGSSFCNSGSGGDLWKNKAGGCSVRWQLR